MKKHAKEYCYDCKKEKGKVLFYKRRGFLMMCGNCYRVYFVKAKKWKLRKRGISMMRQGAYISPKPIEVDDSPMI